MVPSCVSSELSHRGRVARTNDDAAHRDDGRRLYVVSDGVGSCSEAALASRLAVDTVIHAIETFPRANARQILPHAFREANRALQEESRRRAMPDVLAATLSILLFEDEDFHVAHVGDTRVYLLREQRLLQITRDHSVAFEQYWQGAITKDDVRHHRNQNTLTKTLGTSDFLVPDFSDGTAAAGDRFLLCSDGLTKEVAEDRIGAILFEERDPRQACARLVEEANTNGGRDNITVVVADVR